MSLTGGPSRQPSSLHTNLYPITCAKSLKIELKNTKQIFLMIFFSIFPYNAYVLPRQHCFDANIRVNI